MIVGEPFLKQQLC